MLELIKLLEISCLILELLENELYDELETLQIILLLQEMNLLSEYRISFLNTQKTPSDDSAEAL
jgi:hypothetical protein